LPWGRSAGRCCRYSSEPDAAPRDVTPSWPGTPSCRSSPARAGTTALPGIRGRRARPRRGTPVQRLGPSATAFSSATARWTSASCSPCRACNSSLQDIFDSACHGWQWLFSIVSSDPYAPEEARLVGPHGYGFCPTTCPRDSHRPLSQRINSRSTSRPGCVAGAAYASHQRRASG
jgi:hypothetical protein